jgi:hypothetical protein
MLSPFFENAVEVEEFDHFFDAEDEVAESKVELGKIADIDGESSEKFRVEKEKYDGSWVELGNVTNKTMGRLASKSGLSYIGDERKAEASFTVLSDVISESSGKSDDSVITNLINDSDSEASLPATKFIMDENQFQELIDIINMNTDDYIANTFRTEIDNVRGFLKDTIQIMRENNYTLIPSTIREIRLIHDRLTMLSDDMSTNSSSVLNMRRSADRNFFTQGLKIDKIKSNINSLKFRQGLTLVLLLGLIGGVAYAGVELDRLVKAVLVVDNQSQKGCYLFTNDAVPVKLDCSDWYSQGNNKFYCKCGTLTDTKIQPDCSVLPKEECSSPYCLGKTCDGKSADSSITPCKNTYQCTSANRDDPNFISYQYSENVPLQPLIPYTIVNKVTYDYYNTNNDNNNNKTLMYISIGIGVVALLILIFFTVKYYVKNKKKY